MSEYLLNLLEAEKQRQTNCINLIASENYASDYVMRAVGSCFTNKYAEGYPGSRYYSGCELANTLELYCQRKWQKAFETDYCVNVQPHSGTNANFAVYQAVLNPGDTILSMSLKDGGHLSHGSPANLSGQLYKIINYGLDENELIDFDDVESKIEEFHPRLVIAGASSYSREIDFSRFRSIIDRSCGYRPYLMADIAHTAGLVAAQCIKSPFGYADFITMTTQKTLRGARGGLIFCLPRYEKVIKRAVFPGMQGGPLLHAIAGKAATAEEVCKKEFHNYILRVVENSKAMAAEFQRLGHRIVSGGTDNHMFILDLTGTGLTGDSVQDDLEIRAGILVNKNCIPGDKLPPSLASGIRIGTPAMTTMGYTKEDFEHLANCIHNAILRKSSMTKS